MHDWKSTATGVLSFLITTLLVVTGWLGTYMITAPASIQAKMTLYSSLLTLALALCRGWLGIITKNADATATAAAINNVAQSGPAAAPETAASIATTPKQ
jgi:hypothetical protein